MLDHRILRRSTNFIPILPNLHCPNVEGFVARGGAEQLAVCAPCTGPDDARVFGSFWGGPVEEGVVVWGG